MPNDNSKDSVFPFSGGFGLIGGAKKRQEALEWYQNHDAFTNLPNLRMLLQDFSQLEKRAGWALVLIHINHFNEMNSIFGLDLGGATIQRVCPILGEFAKEIGGHAYRISVGRLVLLAPMADRGALLDGLHATLYKMEAVYVEDGHGTVYNYHYTFPHVAYCLSDDPQDYRSAEEVLSFADVAMKRLSGKNERDHAVYDFAGRPQWAKEEILLDDVRDAWKNREFEPYYQPIYDLKSNRPVGAELLIRWRHPQRGLISPGDFLPLLETEGLMMDMDLYMLEAACQMIRSWIDAELVTIPLSINICKQNIHRADFLPRLIEVIASYDIPPVLIELELSEESVLLENRSALSFLADQLHHLGFSLTVDDCGATMFSSISLLRELPLNTVKISPNFLDGVESSTRDRVFVMNVLRLARELGVRPVGTGIETKEQLATWLNMGCSVGQGYYFSQPLSTSEFEKLIF